MPKLTGHVVDLTGTLDRARSARRSRRSSRAFEREHGSQVVVLLVPTIGTETIEEFAGRVTDEWKLGRKGVDDGVLFVIAKQERQDAHPHRARRAGHAHRRRSSKRIVSDIVAPHFRSGDFAGGIDAGTDAIMKAIEGE